MRHWPGYRPTPLRRLPGIAQAMDVAELWYKDEAGRFELKGV
jgi:diaminopropionate ammonia-lyase